MQIVASSKREIEEIEVRRGGGGKRKQCFDLGLLEDSSVRLILQIHVNFNLIHEQLKSSIYSSRNMIFFIFRRN